MLLSELFQPTQDHKSLHGFKIMSLEQFVYSKLYESVEEEETIDETDNISIKNEFGEVYDYNVLKHMIKVRPKQLLKHNFYILKL